MPERRGTEGIRFGIDRIRTAFRLWNARVLDIFGSATGHQPLRFDRAPRGKFWGVPATGQRIETHKISIYRCAEGRIAQQWCVFDEFARFQPLGVDEAYLRRTLKLQPDGGRHGPRVTCPTLEEQRCHT